MTQRRVAPILLPLAAVAAAASLSGCGALGLHAPLRACGPRFQDEVPRNAADASRLARQYLAKPSNSDDIEAAFGHVAGTAEIELTKRSTSIKNLEWERIHQVLVETDFNISETARRLGMHRRTLARKLEKQRVK